MGLANGMFGIVCTLLKALYQNDEFNFRKEYNVTMQNTVDKLLDHILPSGNYPAYLDDKTDEQVSFTQGATGAIFLFTEAFFQYQDEKYIEAAKKCGLSIWYRCLTRPVNSLSRGLIGNVYALLGLGLAANEEIWC
jgi:lantibiotic modifying enzyme